MRAAIIGLYNSGSSVLSQIVENLGANIGRPVWESHFESLNLKNKLKDWWNEPHLTENSEACDRIEYLRLWAEYHEASSELICAKHPLLCLSARDLDEAWGPNYKAVRASRPLATSIRQLKKRGWFSNHSDPEQMQQTLYSACEKYFETKEHLVIDYDELTSNPIGSVERLAKFLELNLPSDRIHRAASLVTLDKRVES